MSSLEILLALLFMTGTSLMIAGSRWARRESLATRLAPYRPVATTPSTSVALASVLLPMAESAGAALSSGLGVTEPLSVRLARAGDERSAGAFRAAQFSAALVTLLLSGLVVVLIRPPIPFSIAAIGGAPLLVALWAENSLDRKAASRRNAIQLELPVVAEQLGILLGAGYSLPASLSRLAARSSGAISTDLGEVVQDIRRGTSEITALQNWASESGVGALDSLVSVLALHHEATDLGALISEEAKSIRAEAHRKRIESIERRAQLVWIPVTVATLVPGLILLAVPFMAALGKVAGP